MKNIKTKMLQDFLNEVVKLEPIEFIGLSKVLCTKLVDENKDARPFEDILDDMIEKFLGTGHKQRRDILKMLRQANKIKVS